MGHRGPNRLPGITASRRGSPTARRASEARTPAVKWVGWQITDGTYAAAGQHLKGLASTLEARKSWFFLDEGIVCLGAGITASDGEAVDTRDRQPPPRPHRHQRPHRGRPPQARLDGLDRDADRPELGASPATVATSSRRAAASRHCARTHRPMNDIRTGSSTTPLTDRYLTLYVGHGTDPVGGAYAYVVLPGAGAARTAAGAASVQGLLRTLANTPQAQGHPRTLLGFTAVNFWTAGTVGDLTADALLGTDPAPARRDAAVCVSDPTRTLTTLTATWRHPGHRGRPCGPARSGGPYPAAT